MSGVLEPFCPEFCPRCETRAVRDGSEGAAASERGMDSEKYPPLKITSSARLQDLKMNQSLTGRLTGWARISYDFGEVFVEDVPPNLLNQLAHLGPDVPLKVTIEVDPEHRIKRLVEERDRLRKVLADAKAKFRDLADGLCE